jgi:hypothetical protein
VEHLDFKREADVEHGQAGTSFTEQHDRVSTIIGKIQISVKAKACPMKRYKEAESQDRNSPGIPKAAEEI